MTAHDPGNVPMARSSAALAVSSYSRILVVGHTPSQISLITELEPEDVANLKPQTASADFANNLRQFVKRKLG